jgi:protoporphyrin/coproporphyrin ferrochelatase
MDQIAVLVMAYGGPDSLDDVEPYLLDVRGGRPTSAELVEEFRERYARIGGRSPLLEITQAQALALEAELNHHSGNVQDWQYRVYLGMRHWYPYIREAVGQIVQHGLRQVVGLCMAPYYSSMSIGAYYKKLQEAQDALGAHLNVTRIESWNDHPLFIEALAERVTEALDRFSPEERDSVPILFSAHSLPAAIIEQGDPYQQELLETCDLLAARLGLAKDRWRFCFQSAGATGARWLGPAIEDVIDELIEAGEHSILVAPVGFVADHVEVLFDIDVECKELAGSRGVRLERTESLNTAPKFIAALAEIVRDATRVPA